MNNVIISFFILLLIVAACENNADKRLAELSEIDQLTKKIASEPRQAPLYIERSEVYRNLKGYDEAISDIKRAILIDSTRAEYFYQLSDTYFDYFDTFQARSILEQATLRFPDSVGAHLKLARLLIIMKDYEDASIALQRAKAADPLDAEVEYARGVFFMDQGRSDAATNAFKAAVELDDELIDGWLSLGQLAAGTDHDVALTYFKNALRVDANNTRALHSMAFFMHNSDSLEQAAQLYQKIIELDSTYIHAYFNQGIIHLEQSKWREAKPLFEKSLALDSSMALAAYYIGLTLDSLGDPEASIPAYQMALRIDSSFARAKVALSGH